MIRKGSKFLLIMLIALLVIGTSLSVHADSGASNSDSINEKLGQPIVVYGAQLTSDQRAKVRELLNVKDGDAVDEYDVSGKDAAKYINGNPNSNMYSSAKIALQEEGNGLTINIVTPENITEVTKEMYANALLTAGVENATVDVASPVKVSGHSALTGIYKAYDVDGQELDKERMELANEELGVATQLAGKKGVGEEKASQLLTEIKKTIAEQNPATKEDVERIVQEQLDKLEISLSEADRQMLINLIDKMRDLNINFDQVKSQLDDISTAIKDKAEELGLDEGFWEKVANFFSELFQAIANFFKGLFS
ncbi:DUF1002 domain-containing protein [Virgibacillus proomii]|jgi:uncharacterized protein YpuA (DUF1002 family)|uniref:DUF1002 domain-containing protein n=1 Tax=Virgibacillus proomii TaxID=84407 RepID=UPI000984DAC9|nr:DUF1002 domain-containing protein [Virgibacillus proomii]